MGHPGVGRGEMQVSSTPASKLAGDPGSALRRCAPFRRNDKVRGSWRNTEILDLWSRITGFEPTQAELGWGTHGLRGGDEGESSVHRGAGFEEAEEGVGEKREEGGGDGSGEDEAVVDGGYAAEDEFAEAAGADGGGDSGDSYAGDGGGAEAGEDNGGGEGKLDLAQALGRGHAECVGYVDEGGVDGADTGVGVAQDGQQGVPGEGEDGEAGSVFSEPRTGRRRPNRASDGMVWTMLAKARTGGAKRSRRVSRIPSGKPMAAAKSMADRVSHRCSKVRRAISQACWWRRSMERFGVRRLFRQLSAFQL